MKGSGNAGIWPTGRTRQDHFRTGALYLLGAAVRRGLANTWPTTGGGPTPRRAAAPAFERGTVALGPHRRVCAAIVPSKAAQQLGKRRSQQWLRSLSHRGSEPSQFEWDANLTKVPPAQSTSSTVQNRHNPFAGDTANSWRVAAHARQFVHREWWSNLTTTQKQPPAKACGVALIFHLIRSGIAANGLPSKDRCGHDQRQARTPTKAAVPPCGMRHRRVFHRV